MYAPELVVCCCGAFLSPGVGKSIHFHILQLPQINNVHWFVIRLTPEHHLWNLHFGDYYKWYSGVGQITFVAIQTDRKIIAFHQFVIWPASGHHSWSRHCLILFTSGTLAPARKHFVIFNTNYKIAIFTCLPSGWHQSIIYEIVILWSFS